MSSDERPVETDDDIKIEQIDENVLGESDGLDNTHNGDAQNDQSTNDFSNAIDDYCAENQENEIAVETNEAPVSSSAQQSLSEDNADASETTRKRKYDAEEATDERNNHNHSHSHGYHSESKRSSNSGRRESSYSDESNEVYVKMLIPSSAAGGVIGRGGENIGQIQKDANVRMKMSKSNDYYPNTNERICMVSGSVPAVLKAHEFIMKKILDKSSHSSHASNDPEDRVNQIKLVIPNSTAGLLIGKGGSYIKQIKDESGAFVKISSKETDLPERILSIDGEPDKRCKALEIVVKRLVEDPQHNSYPSLSYSDRDSHGSSNSSSRNSYNGSSSSSSSSSNRNSSQNSSSSSKGEANAMAVNLAGLNNLAMLIINCGGSSQMTADNLKIALRNSGFSSSATSEIIESITVLMSYGLITKVVPNGLGSIGGSFGIPNPINLLNGSNNLLQMLTGSLGKNKK